MDERRMVELCRSLRFTSPEERPALGECRLYSVILNRETEEGYYARPWNPGADRTLAQLLPSLPKKGWQQFAASWRGRLRRMKQVVRPGARQSCVIGRFPADTVVIQRSQKVIVVNRHARWVLHLLRKDMEHARYLLQNELDASQALPDWTIPVLTSHLEHPPYFIVQPYIPYTHPADWRQLLPDMGRITEALFLFYLAFGLEQVPAAAYVEDLNDRLRAALLCCKEQEDASRLELLLVELRRVCLGMIHEYHLSHVVLARAHGDFISWHVVLPLGGADSGHLLVDWSESHVYSIFHDFFYFHFQNHYSDFWDRFPSLTEDGLGEYYGEGMTILQIRLAQKIGRRPDLGDIRFNLMLGFLQELEHRLCRLHPRYLPFWIQQAERALRSIRGQ
jgi:hypothetical protein